MNFLRQWAAAAALLLDLARQGFVQVTLIICDCAAACFRIERALHHLVAHLLLGG